MQNTVTFGRRGLAAISAAPSTPTASGPPASGPKPLAASTMVSYEHSEAAFSSFSGLSIGSVVAMLFSAQGRISRVHYCIQSLITSVVYIVLLVATRMTLSPLMAGLIGLPLAIAFLWSLIAIRIKRWHDRDKSGWWCMILFIPVAGWVWAAVECRYLSGTRGPNRFGQDPRSPVRIEEIFA